MSLEKVEACPICQGIKFKPFLLCKDFTTSSELFHVEQCESCDFVFTSPRPSASSSAYYYQSRDYISHAVSVKGLIDHIYLIIRYFTLNWKYRLVKPYLQDNTLLDVGCGTGSFLTTCRQSGLQVLGVEPSPQARAVVEKNKINVVATIDDIADMHFDVITLWHVLEHIYDLRRTIEQLKSRLRENGTIFIAVPNRQSPDATHYREMWAAYDVPRHLWHFSKKDMTLLIEHAGLKVIKIIPMKLDAYYVSLLSEKYRAPQKSAIHAALKAVWNGLRSNAKAASTMNHSSLIYIVQK